MIIKKRRMIFKHDIKVRGFHIDVYGHVNNARYLEFLEEARWAYVEETEFIPLLTKKNWGLVVININITYKRPAFMDDILEVGVSFERMGNSSMTVKQDITKKGSDTILTSAEVTFVIIDLDTHKPVRITEDVKDAFIIK